MAGRYALGSFPPSDERGGFYLHPALFSGMRCQGISGSDPCIPLSPQSANKRSV